MQKLLLALLLIVAVYPAMAQTPEHSPLLSPDSVRKELSALFEELRIKHPGFYRYNQPEEFDFRIDSILSTLDSPLTEIDLFRKVKPIFAQIGCLHTGIHLSDSIEHVLNQQANCLPLSLYWDAGQVYVWGKYGTDNSMNIGDQVLTLNGRDIKDIYEELLKSIPMDGYNQTGKYKLLQYSFPQWYRNIIEVVDSFVIKTADGKSHQLQGVQSQVLMGYKEVMDQPLALTTKGATAIVKIPSFAHSYHKENGQVFKKEVKKYFLTMEKAEIERLVIDVRENTGGSDSNAAWLVSHFFDKPFRYWKDIEITEALAQEVSGITRLFYGKPRQEYGKWQWSDKGLLSKEFKFTQVQKPTSNPFKGEVYILTDGLCLSSCADFVAIMQHHQKALVLGEETGGGYQGNTSGLIPSEELPSGLLIDVPLLKYANFVDPNKNIGRGTIPDIEAKPTLEEILDDNLYWERIWSLMEGE